MGLCLYKDKMDLNMYHKRKKLQKVILTLSCCYCVCKHFVFLVLKFY